MSRTNPSKAQRNSAARAKAEQMRREAEARNRRNRNIIVGITLVVVIGLCIAILVAWQSASRQATLNAAGPDGLTDRGGIVVGPQTAPVTVTVMSDFQCPACASFEQANAGQLDQLTADGTIKVEYVPVSILDRFSQGARYSTRSASAAFCVAETDKDKYAAFQETMFANQPSEGTSGMTSQDIAALAAGIGVSQAGQDCITADRYTGFATRVTEDASAAGMRGTPTIYINDEQLEDWSPASMKAAIDAAARG